MKLRTTIEQDRASTAGIPVPDDFVTALGGRSPSTRGPVTLNGLHLSQQHRPMGGRKPDLPQSRTARRPGSRR